MVAVPSPRTWVDLEIPPVATWNQSFYEVWQFVLNPPMVRARQTTTQSIANQTWVAINFQVEDVDTHGFHSTVTNPSRFTPTVPGRYVGSYGVSFKTNSSGRRVISVRKNGSEVFARTDNYAPSTGNMCMKGNAFGPVYFNGTTDYIEVMAYQNTGAALETDPGTVGSTDYEIQPDFYMRWWSS